MASVGGALPVQIPQYATFCAAVLTLVPDKLATDIFFIGGNASKVITVTHVVVTGIATGGVNAQIQLVRRATANIGGNITPIAPTTHDTTNPPASASVGFYTTNPTSLGAGTVVRVGRLTLPTAGSVNSPGVLDWNFFAPLNTQGLALRGTDERLCVNLNAVTISGASLSIWCGWLED